jgi:flagellar biosynthesis protein FlhB
MTDSSGAERTLQPSARRIARARRAGQLAISTDLISACAFSAVCAALIAGGPGWVGGLLAQVRTRLAGAAAPLRPARALVEGLQAATMALTLPLAVVIACGALVGLAQTRGSLATQRWRQGGTGGGRVLGRLLGAERVLATTADIVKLGLLGVVAVLCLRPCLPAVASLAGNGAMRVLTALAVTGRRLALGLSFAMVALACGDYLWRVWRHRRRLLMTRAEARREQRESEGDPVLKAERQRLHQELQLADLEVLTGGRCVLFVDPGRAMVAVAVDQEPDGSTVLLARVSWVQAHELEKAAAQLAVPKSLEPSLVRALAGVRAGEQIPPALAAVVAQGLARARPPAGGKAGVRGPVAPAEGGRGSP